LGGSQNSLIAEIESYSFGSPFKQLLTPPNPLLLLSLAKNLKLKIFIMKIPEHAKKVFS